MENEMIDWFSENGEYKGVVDKAIAHQKGLWHKSVHVWIVNSKNQILLQKRCKDKKFFPLFWDCSFAGHIGAGESSLVSAIREGEEELGLIVDQKQLEFAFTIKERFTYKDITSNEFVDVYVLRNDVDVKKLRYQKEEVENAQYFEIDEIFGENRAKDIFPHEAEFKLLEKYLTAQKEICNA